MNWTDKEDIKEFVKSRLNDGKAQNELKSIGDCDFDWRERVEYTCNTLVPLIISVTPTFIALCEKTINSAAELHEDLTSDVAKQIRSNTSYKDLMASLEEKAFALRRFIGHLESQQVSAEIQRVISGELQEILIPNGNSIYPDFYLKIADYEFLPFQDRKNPINGPCRKNKKSPRPSNVPDGLELKTNRGSKISVDAHGAHPGLHLGVTWDFANEKLAILGVYVSYIRVFDHTMSSGNVDVTTKKASFSHKNFIPIVEK